PTLSLSLLPLPPAVRSRVNLEQFEDGNARPKLLLRAAGAAKIPLLGGDRKRGAVDTAFEFNAYFPLWPIRAGAFVKVDVRLDFAHIDRSLEFDEFVF